MEPRLWFVARRRETVSGGSMVIAARSWMLGLTVALPPALLAGVLASIFPRGNPFGSVVGFLVAVFAVIAWRPPTRRVVLDSSRRVIDVYGRVISGGREQLEWSVSFGEVVSITAVPMGSQPELRGTRLLLFALRNGETRFAIRFAATSANGSLLTEVRDAIGSRVATLAA